MQFFPRIFKRAPEFEGITTWINSKPLKMQDLRGKIVLIDFWTYSCINCIRTLPELLHLYKKYSKKGLVIIGVHSPEFDFEKKIPNIKAAIKKYAIPYPVIVDNDMHIWNSYFNAYWPRHYLIDAEGKIRYDHIGEGGEEELEEWIITLLKETGTLLQTHPEKEKHEKSIFGITPETYVGANRSSGIGSASVCLPGGKCGYLDQGNHKLGIVYLHGSWEQEPEYALHQEYKEGYISLTYLAHEANVVLGSTTKIQLEVLLDGKPLRKDQAGKDVFFKNGKSYLNITREDLYRVVKTQDLEEHELKLVVKNKGLRVYAYTFG